MGYVGLSVNRARKYIANNNSQVWRFLVLNMLLKLSRLRGNSYYMFTYFSLSNMYVFFFFVNIFFNYLFRKYNFFIILHATRKIIHEKAHNLTWSMTFSFFFWFFYGDENFFGSFILIENLLFFKSIFFMW